MGDPSQRIDPVLYPKLPHLSIPQIIQYLSQAVGIVNEVRPVSWTYIQQAPTDGTAFLEWISPSRGPHFASDGYLWADSEISQERELNREISVNMLNGEYILDIMVHNIGFIPHREQVASHARHRYRIRKKDGSASQFNPNLWLIHYRPSESNYRIPVQNIAPHPAMHQIVNDRNAIQQQGQLQRKEFMLPDRAAWPQISFPSRRMSSQQYAPGYFQPPTGAQPMAGPPAKRPRQSGAAALAPGPVAPMQMRQPNLLPHEVELEEAEDTMAGDYLDYITPASISKMRYKMHTLWMEEILSSMYAVNQILPEDLGFGLVGELGDITNDILLPPSITALRKAKKKSEKDGSEEEVVEDDSVDPHPAYKPLDAEKFAEFEKRVEVYTASKKKEISEMKARHAKLMSQMDKGRLYIEAEEKLKAAGTDSAKMDAIVRQIEKEMGVTIEQRKDVVCVQAGPTADEEDDYKPKTAKTTAQFGDATTEAVKPVGSGGSVGAGVAAAAADGTVGLLDEFTSSTDLIDDIDMDVDVGGDVNVNIPPPENGNNHTSTNINKPVAEIKSVETAITPANTDGDQDMLQSDSMFENTDFTNFDGMEETGYAGDNADELLDFEGGFGVEGAANE